ncbi:hypothetical protein ABK040_007579 [Willaertia magna]
MLIKYNNNHCHFLSKLLTRQQQLTNNKKFYSSNLSYLFFTETSHQEPQNLTRDSNNNTTSHINFNNKQQQQEGKSPVQASDMKKLFEDNPGYGGEYKHEGFITEEEVPQPNKSNNK